VLVREEVVVERKEAGGGMTEEVGGSRHLLEVEG
jgi:hypothetical protein